MNYVALLVFSAVSLFILFLIFTPFAGAYEMEFILQWSTSPNICIWDNKYNHLFEKGVLDWNEALQTLGDEWVLLYKIVDGHTAPEILEYCDINLVLVESWITKGGNYTGMLGRASATPDTNIAFAVIYEERDPAHYFDFDDAIVKTVKHELGHTFGLGHWEPENTYEALRPWPATLMFGTSDKYYNGTVDSYTLDALACWYGEDAWEYNNRDCLILDNISIPKLNYSAPHTVNFTFTL